MTSSLGAACVHMVIEFSTLYNSYKLLGVFLEKKEASEYLKSVVFDNTLAKNRTSVRYSPLGALIYSKETSDYWIKSAKIGVHRDCYLTAPNENNENSQGLSLMRSELYEHEKEES